MMISLALRRIAINTVDYNPVELQYTAITEEDVMEYMEENPPPELRSCNLCKNWSFDSRQWTNICSTESKYYDDPCNCPEYACGYYTIYDLIADLHADGAFIIPMDTPQEMVSYLENLLNDLI